MSAQPRMGRGGEVTRLTKCAHPIDKRGTWTYSEEWFPSDRRVRETHSVCSACGMCVTCSKVGVKDVAHWPPRGARVTLYYDDAEPMNEFWAVEWHSKNLLDGETRHLMWGHPPTLFRTRRECRAHIEAQFGYIRQRPDLRTEPHGWRLPRAVRVVVR